MIRPNKALEKSHFWVRVRAFHIGEKRREREKRGEEEEGRRKRRRSSGMETLCKDTCLEVRNISLF